MIFGEWDWDNVKKGCQGEAREECYNVEKQIIAIFTPIIEKYE